MRENNGNAESSKLTSNINNFANNSMLALSSQPKEVKSSRLLN